MKKLITILFICLFFVNPISIFAQEEAETEKDMRPVRFHWATNVLIDHQTVNNLPQGTFQYMIYHRFGKMDNGVSDFWGIYAPSNISMGVHYGITNKLSVGISAEKNNKLQSLSWKYNIIQQTRGGSIPVDVAYTGNISVDTRIEEVFGQNYDFTNRLSYHHSLIVARKINDDISIQAALDYTHFNTVAKLTRHDILAWHVGGRYRFYNENSIVFEYTSPMDINLNGYSNIDGFQAIAKPGLSFGWEWGTSTHAFQLFASNYEHIVAQKNIAFNNNEIGDLLLGFNITVRF